jgi:hypothetical protein
VNVLSVEGVLPEGRSHSFFVLDWIEASFERAGARWPARRISSPAARTAVSAAAFADPLAVALDGTESDLDRRCRTANGRPRPGPWRQAMRASR